MARYSTGWSPTACGGIFPAAARDKAWRHARTEESGQAERTPVAFSAAYFSQCSPSPSHPAARIETFLTADADHGERVYTAGAMEKTRSQIEADITSLRRNAIKFRTLAIEHRAANNTAIANKLLEVVADLEKAAAEMQVLLKERSRAE
jgi:hypothetical protein